MSINYYIRKSGESDLHIGKANADCEFVFNNKFEKDEWLIFLKDISNMDNIVDEYGEPIPLKCLLKIV